jgi:hypothetical protein
LLLVGLHLCSFKNRTIVLWKLFAPIFSCCLNLNFARKTPSFGTFTVFRISLDAFQTRLLNYLQFKIQLIFELLIKFYI